MRNVILTAILSCMIICANAQKFESLSGPYLGQTPPGLTAELFAPEIISTLNGKEMCAAITRDGKEFYYNDIYKGSYSIFMTKEIDGKWTEPKPLHFSSHYKDRDFTMSPDGNAIYFGSNRPADNTGKALDKLDLYVTKRLESGEWSDPVSLGSPVNTEFGENYPAVSDNGNLYYFSCRKDGWGGCDLFMAHLVDGKYQEPILMGNNLNTEKHEWDCCIAPDESFIIFSSMDRDDTHGTQDLYISFKNEKGEWSKAKNMGLAVNSSGDEICPSLSLDGKYLFFTSRRRGFADVYWVSTKIIDKFREEIVELKGEYMGQNPPGIKPVQFLNGVVSTPMNELNATFSLDGNEFYFTRRNEDGLYVIMQMKRKNGIWNLPEVADFSGTYQEADPLISPDGNYLFYISKKPDLSKGPPHDIVYLKRSGNAWSEPVHPKSPLNSEYNEIYPCLTLDGNLYFNCDKPGGLGSRDIYVSKFENGEFSEPTNVGEPISSEYREGDIFIAPDESYAIFTSVNRPGGFGSGDLYICFKEENGEWSEPINMGSEINTKGYDYSPVVSHDGKYFFFSKHRDIYWVSTQIFENLKESKYENTN